MIMTTTDPISVLSAHTKSLFIAFIISEIILFPSFFRLLILSSISDVIYCVCFFFVARKLFKWALGMKDNKGKYERT